MWRPPKTLFWYSGTILPFSVYKAYKTEPDIPLKMYTVAPVLICTCTSLQVYYIKGVIFISGSSKNWHVSYYRKFMFILRQRFCPPNLISALFRNTFYASSVAQLNAEKHFTTFNMCLSAIERCHKTTTPSNQVCLATGLANETGRETREAL